ncbi:MAG: TetR/AcrR family transcriptional regulator [Actinomycetota bacterium]
MPRVSSERSAVSFGKPGRPPEDRLARQRAIYERVAPLVLDRGPRAISMREAAQAAHMSVGGLYHYFPTKRDLVLHALRPEAFARLCDDFEAVWRPRRRTDPEGCLAAFVDHFVTQVVFVRPSLHAALELGSDTFWDAIDAGITAGLDEFSDFLRDVVPTIDDQALPALARSLRRAFFAALLDKHASADALRDELRALVAFVDPPAPARS